MNAQLGWGYDFLSNHSCEGSRLMMSESIV